MNDDAQKLVDAVRSDCIDEVRSLLCAGAHLRARFQPDEWHPLDQALLTRREEAALALLDAGCVSQRADQASPLFQATWSEKITTRLLADGTDPNQRHPVTGQTPVYNCAAQGTPEVMALLARAGANLDSCHTNAKGFKVPALVIAAYRLNHEMVGAMIGLGCDPNVRVVGGLDEMRDSDQWSALHAAARPFSRKGGMDVADQACAFREVLCVLTKAGLPLDIRDGAGRTPLHVAAAHSDVSMMAILLEAGASECVVDHNGLTPAQVVDPARTEKLRLLEAWAVRRHADQARETLRGQAGSAL